ncbi:WD40-repeat-containing domain protein [Apiospora kogelbergensis]|uniref:WD40-repeat-containing domain protein n=1 Tax=Apiospora kogelbergensis TaxID=1337665 RepID=UPI0031325DB7
MNQSQGYAGAPRQSATDAGNAGLGAGTGAGAAAPGGYAAQHDELHISPTMTHPTPRDLSHTQPTTPAYPSSNSQSSVPNVLQPGGLGAARPPAMSANTAPTLPTMSTGIPLQQSPTEYSSPSKPPSLTLSASTSHAYSRSSPAAPFESSGFTPYTPTTPGGSAGPSQYMSPQDPKYGAPGSQRNISNTPLGLADIRPRADSSLSDGTPGTLAYELANGQPSTSNYLAPWALYAFDWCKWAPQGKGAGKVAIGSYLEDGHNFIQILDTQVVNTPNDIYTPGSSKHSIEFTKVAEATHSYPVTRLLWEPPSSQKQSTDLLATSGDHLRLWSLPSDAQSSYGNNVTRPNANAPITKLTPLALLSNSKTPDHTAPLTSLDWNQVSPSLIITSSIDTTCTIWDIPSLTAKTQLIAHDKEVYDVRFCANTVDVFVSCGQDGSVRMFDLRSLEHSTIIYEPTAKDERDATGGRISPTLAQQTMTNAPPLMRLATSPHDTHLLATPARRSWSFGGHGGSVNCVEWSPLRRGTLASGGDDSMVLVWDLMNTTPSNAPSNSGPGSTDKHLTPVASWQCDYEVGNLGWTPPLPNSDAGEWLGVSGGRGVWGVKI